MDGRVDKRGRERETQKERDRGTEITFKVTIHFFLYYRLTFITSDITLQGK